MISSPHFPESEGGIYLNHNNQDEEKKLNVNLLAELINEHLDKGYAKANLSSDRSIYDGQILLPDNYYIQCCEDGTFILWLDEGEKIHRLGIADDEYTVMSLLVDQGLASDDPSAAANVPTLKGSTMDHVRLWYDELEDSCLVFHPEDHPLSIRSFSPSVARVLHQEIRKASAVCKLNKEDICAIALHAGNNHADVSPQ